MYVRNIYKTMNKLQIAQKKKQFLIELKKSRGLIMTACVNADISRVSIHNWRHADKEFDNAIQDIIELEGDKVESSFKEHLDAKDLNAIFFYLKTKLKSRGYTERDNVANDDQPTREKKSKPLTGASVTKKINSRIKKFTDMMKEQGIYQSRFDEMIKLAATTSVKYDAVFAETMKADYKPYKTEISREGNERLIVNPIEGLLRNLAEQLQSQLRALGLNTDSKPIQAGDDSMADFMSQFDKE